MTTNEMLASIKVGTAITAEMEAVAQKELARNHKMLDNRKAKNAKNRDTEYEPLVNALTELLKANTDPMIATDIATVLGIDPTKVYRIAARVPNMVVGSTKLKSGREVHTYTLEITTASALEF